jgi:hypothetical protein
LATIAELATREAELVAELESVREEIASRHGEIETAEADTTGVETATRKRTTRTK